MKRYTSAILSDFNAENFARYLNNDGDLPAVTTVTAPYGQVQQALIYDDHEIWQTEPDFAVIWTRPQGVIASFNRLLQFEHVPLDTILSEVDEYSAQLQRVQHRVDFMFVPTWTVPTYELGIGMLDMRDEIGIANTLLRMNLRLIDNLRDCLNLYVLNSQHWIENAGKNAFHPKLWYMAKVPFGNDVFKEAVASIKSGLASIAGKTRKLVVVDLDNTLWGGVVGDVGWEQLQLGGHDPAGEAYVDFQRALKGLAHRGIVLGIASKNEEATALHAIQNHPEMVLTLDDFAHWKINWNDKAQNLIDLVSELQLGLDSVVFIDDNPVERARVREALPQVLVPEMPEDVMLYPKTLLSLRCFDKHLVTAEDSERTHMYVTDRQRNALKSEVGSLDAWLDTLEITVKVQPLNPVTLPRAAQLLNKTNQLNLTTRRMTEIELMAWAKANAFWTFSVSDKFGDSGLTGLLGIQLIDRKAKIVDFVLSCRVMGRKIEETLLAIAVAYARSMQIDAIYAEYVPTLKNKPCLDFFMRSGFEYDSATNVFSWDCANQYPVPKQIVCQQEQVLVHE